MSHDESACRRNQRQLEFYERILEIGMREDAASFLRAALDLATEITNAGAGYIEIRASSDADRPSWWAASSLTDAEVQAVRAAVSQGVVAEAMASARTVRSVSAIADPRFRDRESVKVNSIGAVVCAPIGREATLGVVYLQGGSNAAAFSDEDVRLVETFARYLTPHVEHLVNRTEREAHRDWTLGPRSKLALPGVVGSGPALARLLEGIALVAPLDIDVLLTGPTGSGKTMFARVIAQNSQRAAGPFVELNCAALPESLLESELFGALPGSHSTATNPMQGKVAAAERGTLFLDEVGDLPLPAQAKLLQLLQEKAYYPLGATHPVRADVRIIAATNVDLQTAITAGRFRADLYWRLHVIPLRVPGLAERREDIPALIDHCCREACRRLGFPPLSVAPSALDAAQSADWPGHIRQLTHAVERAVIHCHGSGREAVRRQDLFPTDEAAADPHRIATFEEATLRFQRQHLLEALEETQWNVSETARLLELARSHVYNLMNLHGLRRDLDTDR